MKTISGYVLEAKPSDEATVYSYDKMKTVGKIRLHDKPTVDHGDDLDDAPFDPNGDIYSGREVELQKGDYVIIVRQNGFQGETWETLK